MNKHYFLFFFIILSITFIFGQQAEVYTISDHYTKQEVAIPMRDGTKLHTSIYSPKDTSTTYPILMKRTPYSLRPYGPAVFPSSLGPNAFLTQEGNIFVHQDVRGRYKSEGQYDNMRAYIPNKKKQQFDESSDAYDTIDWLVKNVANNNGKVGIWGISYPGFYATCSLIDAHPALKAVSPQACIGDFYFDDFHHNGAYLLSYWMATAVFGYQKSGSVENPWYPMPQLATRDQFDFFMDQGPLQNLDAYYQEDNEFWTQLKEHPDYDEFWKSRGIIQHLKDIKPAVMVVGGLFDAEDLYGPLMTYKTIEENSKNKNILVFGPWSHGDWSIRKKRQAIGNVYFGEDLSENYQRDIETPFFNHYLKGTGEKEVMLPEANLFDTGKMEWKSYHQWPPKNVIEKAFYLNAKETLGPSATASTSVFVSDPHKPVPYSEDLPSGFTPRKYMTDDQRFAAKRSDVMVFETPTLEKEMTLAGAIMAKLQVATTGTDADWVVKLIDVYPDDAVNYPETAKNQLMSNYHMMLRSEVMRGRYRDDFSKPEPFVPNKKTAVAIKLQDVHHTFLKGHKIQVQVQSTWFPLIDRNPQTFVPNIFKAAATDFKKHSHTIYHDSAIVLNVLED